MTEKSLARLRKKLPKKWSTILETRTGYDKSTIERQMFGKRKTINYKILKAAIQLAQEEKENLQSLEKKIESL